MNALINPEAKHSWHDTAKIKMILDLVNGMDAALELNTVQQTRLKPVQRALDAISGHGHTRNIHIQDHLIHGIEACRHLIEELSASQTLQGRAMLNIRTSLQNTQTNLANMTEAVVNELARIDNVLGNHADRLGELELISKAEDEWQRWLRKWKSGDLQALSPMARCYSVLEALYWGNFGLFLQQSNNAQKKYDLWDKLAFEITQQLQTDFNTSRDEDIDRDKWLTIPDNVQQEEITCLLQYQGDWVLNDPKSARLTFMATQWPALDMNARRAYERNTYRLIDIKRVSERMVQEMFEVRQ